MNRHITTNAMQRGNIDLIITDGKNCNYKQIDDIKYLLSENIDLLMVSPNEADSLTEIISEIYLKGIPVILIDRKTSDSNYTCFIGADNTIIGAKAADYVGAYGKTGDKIVELHGQKGASATIERGSGFNNRLNEAYKHKKFVHAADLYCEWSKTNAHDQIAGYIASGHKPDIIYAHNDDMAIGAHEAFCEAGYNPDDVLIIGTDGASGEHGGIKAVMENKIDATFFYPDGSEEAINTAVAILEGHKVPKQISLSTVQIDTNNAEGLYGQMTLSRTQEERIINQSAVLTSLNNRIATQTWVIIVAFLLVIVTVVMLIRISRLNKINKTAKITLQEKNAEINAQKEELESQASYLNQINEQLERSKEKTLGSIRCANTIQTAALPTEYDLNYYFNSFVIYHPKDIVSGDFYWYHREVDTEKEIHIFGVIDCTGHGVPGAFMSLIGINLLDQIVKQRKIYSPAVILEELNKAVRVSLRQEESENNDGMEAILCKIERYNDKRIMLTYEGAKFPLHHYIKSTNTIESYKTSRRQIGGKFRNIEQIVNFADHTIEIHSGDRIYMASDGIGDQNNVERKRYTTKRMLNTIFESVDKTMMEQRDYIWNDVARFMSYCEQRDDITVLGIEI
jgi:ABC-type sugar transport system substrate-binding protein